MILFFKIFIILYIKNNIMKFKKNIINKNHIIKMMLKKLQLQL